MKRNLLVILALCAPLYTLPATAQLVTAGLQTAGAVLPGDGGTDANYAFYGNYRPIKLTDFTEVVNGFAPDLNNSILSPDLASVTLAADLTGKSFFSAAPVDLVDFTVLGTAQTNYVLSAAFGANGGAALDGTEQDASFTVILSNAAGTVLSSDTLNVQDLPVTATTSNFASFTLTGLAAGDKISLEAAPVLVGNVGTAYVEAVGFATVATPEPSTFAMIFGGAGLLALFARRRLTA